MLTSFALSIEEPRYDNFRIASSDYHGTRGSTPARISNAAAKAIKTAHVSTDSHPFAGGSGRVWVLICFSLCPLTISSPLSFVAEWVAATSKG
jgi:hypothetical protein